MVWLSILLVTGCAICWDLGVVLQKRAADTLPPLTLGGGLGATLLRFLKSRGWMGGLLVTMAGWGLFAGALTFTPVSLARSIQGVGFVVLALMSVAFLNHRLTVREWLGVAAVTLGVLLLGLSEPSESVTPNTLDLGHLSIGLGAALGGCGVLFLASRIPGLKLAGIVAVAGIAGILLGLGDVLTRAIIIEWGHDPSLAMAVLAPMLVGTYLAGFFILSRSYQRGRAIVATGVSDLAARLVTLFVGVLALDEALPVQPWLRLERVVGFALILAGTATLAHFSAEELASRPSLAPSSETG